MNERNENGRNTVRKLWKRNGQEQWTKTNVMTIQNQKEMLNVMQNQCKMISLWSRFRQTKHRFELLKRPSNLFVDAGLDGDTPRTQFL